MDLAKEVGAEILSHVDAEDTPVERVDRAVRAVFAQNGVKYEEDS